MIACKKLAAMIRSSKLHLVPTLQAPPSLDEDNFPSLATSPGPSPRAAINGPAIEGTSTAVAESHDSESPRAAEISKAVNKTPSVWGSVEGNAHKATTPEKKKSSTAWISSADSMSSQQKAQAANSKLQPSAASFKTKNKGGSKVPWVETGILDYCYYHHPTLDNAPEMGDTQKRFTPCQVPVQP